MFKRIKWKLVFKVFAWLISLTGIIVLMSFINVKKQTVKCKKIDIIIPGADNFIEKDEIDAILKQGQGDLIGRDLEKINLQMIEKNIAANPYIAFVKVFTEMDGTVNVEIKQRQPILRMINNIGQNFYVDTDGLKIPISNNFTANVLVATGQIMEGFSENVDTLTNKMAKDLFKSAVYIQKDSLWNEQIEQLYVNQKNEIELVPRVGNQRIILGNADNLSIKMDNLLYFYKDALPKVGWNAYKTINLKYINQVVCEKRDSVNVNKLNKNLLPDSVAMKRKEIDTAISQHINAVIKQEVTIDKIKKEETKATPNKIKVDNVKKSELKKINLDEKVKEDKKLEVKKK